MKRKKTIFAIVALILVLLVLSVGFNLQTRKDDYLSRTYTIEDREQKVDLIIDYGEGKIATYSAVYGNTVYDVLKHVEEDLAVEKYDFGILISSIGEYENSKDFAWMYYVNSQVGEVAADKYELQDGDVVEWRYIKMQN